MLSIKENQPGANGCMQYRIMVPMFRFDHILSWRLFTVLAAGIALGVAPVYGWWPMALFGVMVTIRVLERAVSLRQAIWFGCVIGLLRSLIVLGWTWATYPIDWMGIKAPTMQLLLIGLYWMIAATALAVGYSVLAVGIHRLRTWPEYGRLVLLPLLWVAAEAIGALCFSLIWYGPGARVGFDFSFGYLGYAAVTHPGLLWLTRLGGVWTLTLGLVASAVALDLSWRSRRSVAVALVFMLFVSGLPFGQSPRPVTSGQTVALVSTQLPAKTNYLGYLFRLGQVRAALVTALGTHASTIILPEDSRFTDLFADPQAALQFIAAHAQHPVVVVDSARVPVGNHVVLRAFIYDTHADTYYTFDKQYLVPQGEFEPYLTRWLANILPISAATKYTISDTSYEPGMLQRTVSVPAYVPAVLFCFESVTPWGVRDAIAGRTTVPFVAHVVSHDWFHGRTPFLDRQLDAMLQVQAAWNQVPIYMATNDDTPAIYYPNGHIVRPHPTRTTPYWSVYIVGGI